MAAWSIIKKSELELGSRLDAEYYQLYYLAFDNKMKSISFKYLKEISERISRGKQPEYVEYGNIFAFTSEQIRNDFVARDSARFTNQIFYEKNIKAHAKYNDVLLNSTGRGTLGRVNFYYLKDKAVVDGHITIIRTKEDIINPIFLNVFLKTIYGQYQIERAYTGSSGQIEIYPDQIKEFKIYIPPLSIQDDISDFIKKAINLKLESEKFYSKAEQILLEELGLKDLDLKDDLFYTTTLKEIKDNNRMDAEYYIPKYEELIAHIRNYKNDYCGLLDIAQNITTNYDPLKEGECFRYIELSNIQASIGIIENARKLRTEDAPLRAKRKLKKGDVIVSSIKGSLDKTAMVVSDFSGAFASNGFFQFRAKSVNPAYLTLLIKSDIVYLQLFKEASGAILSAVPKESLKNIIIPKLDKNIQEEISKLVQNAHEKYHKSKLLLEQAKHKVEEMIEKEAGVK